MSAPAAPPKMRPAVPVSVSGAPVPVTVSSGVPMQVVSKSAAYPAGAPITYYRPPGPGVPGPGVTYPAGYVGSGPTAVPQGRVMVGQAPGRIVRTSQATPLPLSKSPPMSQPTRPNTVGGPAYSQSAYETKHEKDEQLQNLKELRKTCGLKEIPVNDGLQAFKKGGSDALAGDESFSKLTREKFVETYSALLQDHKVEVPSDDVKNAVFDLFDRDDNNVVDMMELVCGISLLCKGSEDDKIQAVFKVFDENDDGFISMDEMYKFLTSVFKVVLTPAVLGAMNSMGVNVESAEDLASVTSLECFKSADLNHDGRLSIEEFKSWFYGPRNDPAFMFSPVRKLLQ